MIDKTVPKSNRQYFRSISDLCKSLGVPNPSHPLMVFINHKDISKDSEVKYMVHDFYMVSFKSNLKGKLKYGQGYYDFDEGGLIFVAPNQALSVVDDEECQGYSLFFHPDFLAGYPLSNSLKKFGFFSYNINEALHLSDREKVKILDVLEDIKNELDTPIDNTSQDLIVSFLEVLLNYSNRFYKRQFITRKSNNNSLLERFESLLSEYFFDEKPLVNGIPSVQYFSDQLNISSNYLSDMLRTLTGLNTQQHIHSKLIAIAKQKLAISDSTAAEIAFELGFEHPQSFNKLFKKKTKMTPVQFRNSLN